MAEVLGSEWFPEDERDFRDLYRRHIAGSYHTNWGLISDGARSNLILGLEKAAEFLNQRQRLLEKGQAAAEVDFLLGVQYRISVIGPFLGAVTASFMAAESFLRLVAELDAEDQSAEAQEKQDEALAKVDQQSLWERAAILSDRAGAGPLPKDLEQGLEALVLFRNDLTHDSPIRFEADGTLQRWKRSKRRKHEPERKYGGKFPPLYDNYCAIQPEHGLRAAELHDALVSHVLDHGRSRLVHGVRQLATRAVQKIGDVRPITPGQVEQIVTRWREYVAWSRSIPTHERREVYERIVESGNGDG